MDPLLIAQINAGLARMGIRSDANETAMFARSLLQVKTQTYDIVYPDLKARTLFPVDTSINTGAKTYAYRQFDKFGRPKPVNDYAKDFPNIGINGQEFILPIKSFGASYQYSYQDLRAAAFAQTPLEAMQASAVRESMERQFEEVCAYGNADLNFDGFASAPANLNIPETTSTGIDWSTGTVANILLDVDKMSKKIFDQTKGKFKGNVLLLGTVEYSAAATRRVAEAYASNVSILQYILAASPWLTDIVHWPMLDNADGGTCTEFAGPSGGASRKMMYQRDPLVVSSVIPQEFEQFAPQQENMAFVVPCHARFAGVRVTYPLACTFMDLT